MLWAIVVTALLLSTAAVVLPGALARGLSLAGRGRRPRRPTGA